MQEVTHTDIARRAYELWEREGWPNGRDLDHWLRAEREILHQALALKTPDAQATAAQIGQEVANPSIREQKKMGQPDRKRKATR
jgi:hypothetical protein